MGLLCSKHQSQKDVPATGSELMVIMEVHRLKNCINASSKNVEMQGTHLLTLILLQVFKY